MDQDQYVIGAAWAEGVQQGLAEGKTFEEMNAFTPEWAIKARNAYQARIPLGDPGDKETYELMCGYLSRWD